VLDHGFNFILVCQPESHPTLYGWLAGLELAGELQQFASRRWNGRFRTILYRNALATQHPLDHTDVEAVVQAGRARWKIENESNNTLKTKGDHLDHIYGHGQQHLSAVLLPLKFLTFLFHTVLGWVEQKYHLVRQALAARHTFFQDLQALTRYLLFESWEHLLDFMLQGLEIASPPDAS